MTSPFDRYQQGVLSTDVFPSVVREETWTQKNWSLSNQDRARRRVYEYIKDRLEKTDTHVIFGEDCVYIVWFAFVLGNWKALITTTLPDGMYYEVTYKAAEGETYVDAYKKFDHISLPD